MEPTAAIFVDAGYFFAQGSYAKAGLTKKRNEIDFDAAKFMPALADFVERTLPQRTTLLRIYWYDGARNGNCTPEQLKIGALEHVKLRVGRINGQGQQKGVDTLIVRDLMVLSQERSINYAVVVSGDEDLREGIEYAQDRGVVVNVVGIRGRGGTSQSPELVREADEALELDPRCLEHLTILEDAPQDHLPMQIPSEADRIADSVRTFVEEWAQTAGQPAVAAVLAAHPSIPKDVDGALLRAVGKALSRSLREDETSRRLARQQFWKLLRDQSVTSKVPDL